MPSATYCSLAVLFFALLGIVSARYEYTKYVSDPVKMMMEKPSPYGMGSPQLRSYRQQLGLLKRRWSGRNGYFPNRSPYDMSAMYGALGAKRMSVPYHSYFIGI